MPNSHPNFIAMERFYFFLTLHWESLDCPPTARRTTLALHDDRASGNGYRASRFGRDLPAPQR